MTRPLKIASVLWCLCSLSPYATYAQRVVADEDRISVELRSPTDSAVQPGQIVTYVGHVINLEGEIETVRPTLAVPRGWRLLSSLDQIQLDVGESDLVFLPVRVPSDAVAGQYELTLVLTSESADQIRWTDSALIEVGLVRKIETFLDSTDEVAAAGTTIERHLTILNTGNSTDSLSLSAHASNYLIKISPERVALGPGESARVTTQLKTDRRIPAAQKVSLRIRASSTIDSSISSTLVDAITILPSHSNGSSWVRAPSSLVVRSVGDERSNNPELAFQSAIPMFGGSAKVDIQLTKSDRVSIFGTRNRYSASFQKGHSRVLLGDHIQPISPMTTRGQFGMGVGGELVFSRWKVRSTLQQSRHLVPSRRLFGGAVVYDLSNNHRISSNYASHDGLYRGWVTTLRLDGTTNSEHLGYDLECGIDGQNRFDRPSCSAELFGHSRRLIYRARLLQAPENYPGYQSGVSERSMSFSFRPSKSVRLNTTARIQSRSIQGGVGRKNRYVRTGLGLSLKFGRVSTFTEFQYIGQVTNHYSTLFNADRSEHIARLSLSAQASKVGFQGTIDLGTAKSQANSYDGRVTRGRLMMRAAIAQWLTLSTAAEKASGFLIDTPSGMERWLFNLDASVRIGNRTSANIGLYRSVTSSTVKIAYQSVRFDLSHKLSNDHEVRFQMLHSAFDNSRAGGSTDYRLSYAVPLSIPVPGTHAGGQYVRGRIYDFNTGTPIVGATVFLGDEAALSDSNGYFRVRAPTSGRAYLRIDQRSIGLDLIPVRELPLLVEPIDGSYQEIDIPVTISGSISGQILLSDGLTPNRILGAALDPISSELPARDVVLELRSENRRVRTKSDRWGRYTFSHLPSGSYELSIVGGLIPDGYTLPDGPLTLEIREEAHNSIDLYLEPAERKIRFLTSTEKPVSTSAAKNRSSQNPGGN